ncbi:hypothetical protein Tco_0924558 [Tanacetum coccineum]|uniref:Uncharacterized protein n=1 Tax=Tanacetum coccineum TaxID=301880 RepID=A0ABQ5DAI1_9ASTR
MELIIVIKRERASTDATLANTKELQLQDMALEQLETHLLIPLSPFIIPYAVDAFKTNIFAHSLNQFKDIFLASKGVNATDPSESSGYKDFGHTSRAVKPSAYRREQIRDCNLYAKARGNVNMREAVDVGLVVTESSGSYTTQAVDADIRPVHDDEPFAEVQLTALHNILANEQQHTEQSEPSYDTHLLETIDSNTTPTSTNMCS